MAVLVCLARHAPRVVSREQLLEEAWADSPYIGDEALSHAIWELRRVFEDSRSSPAYIKTIHGKGYLLLPEVLRPQGSPLPIEGARIDHYDIQEELGRGSMGVVFKALDRRLGRTVAVKFLASELTRDLRARQRFQREARVAASLDHPNLATLHEIGETAQGHLYLVTPFYPGGSLQDRLAQGPVPVDEALNYVRQIAAGLSAAHQRSIIHRDIKPSNLLLDEHGTVKIADFGIAKLIGGTDLTRTGASLGTPAYKSPEQSQGLEVDHRTDLWSLGVVLFELLTGRRPFPGEHDQAVVSSILSGEPAPLADAQGRPLPSQVAHIVSKAMAKDREKRFQRAEEMLAELGGLERHRSPLQASKPRSRRVLTLSLAGALAGLLVAAMLVGQLWLSFAPSPPPSPTKMTDPQPEPAETSLELEQAQRLWLRGNDPENLGEVERLLRLAHRRQPTSPEVLAHLAMFYADRYSLRRSPVHIARARTYAREAQALDRDNSLALAAVARLSLELDQLRAAETQARRAVEIEPRCRGGESCDFAYVALGEALWELDRRQEAFSVLEAGTEVGGGFVRCWLKIGQLHKWFQQRPEEENAYRKVLDIEPDQTTALNELGILLYYDGKFEESADLLEHHFKLTGAPNAVLNLGNAYYGGKKWAEAVSSYLRAHDLYQELGEVVPTPLVNIGDVYLESGDLARARESFEQAISLFERLAAEGSLSSLRGGQFAVCLAKAGRFEEATMRIRRLLREERKTLELVRNAAQICALKEDRACLFEYARQALDMGIKATDLILDPAFIKYREDEGYRQLLELPVP